MSTTGFTVKHLRNDREKEIYLEAFWHGVAANINIQAELFKLEKEWKDGQERAENQIQYYTD